VDEWYSTRYALPIYAMSSTKSVTGLLAMMLVADGRIRTLDDAACRYVKEWCSGIRGQVTIRHLLSMTSGLLRLPPDSSVGFVEDKDAYVISLVPAAPPGTVWAYSNEGAQLMSVVLDAAANEPIQAYAARRLFAPIGMHHSSLHLDGEGHAWTYADMLTTARDFARIGVLVLHRGKWGDQQVVPAAMLDSLFTPQALNPRYGMLWWLDREVGGVATHGHLDTDVHVLPASDLVIVRMQSKPYPGVTEGTYERELLTLLRATENLTRN
jgi:CubicO group peptidase (beta-lactamase class C family)